jgi:hypothetical protein
VTGATALETSSEAAFELPATPGSPPNTAAESADASRTVLNSRCLHPHEGGSLTPVIDRRRSASLSICSDRRRASNGSDLRRSRRRSAAIGAETRWPTSGCPQNSRSPLARASWPVGARPAGEQRHSCFGRAATHRTFALRGVHPIVELARSIGATDGNTAEPSRAAISLAAADCGRERTSSDEDDGVDPFRLSKTVYADSCAQLASAMYRIVYTIVMKSNRGSRRG